MQIDTHEPPLSAPLRLSFDYTRSVGPLLSQFFTALRERRIVGVRGSDGRVHVPPAEFDPVTYERLTEIVPVSSVGTVVSWTWQPQPLEVTNERIEQERDHGCDEEEEDDVPENPGQHPDDQQPDGKADELDPAGHPDGRPRRLAHRLIVATPFAC